MRGSQASRREPRPHPFAAATADLATALARWGLNDEGDFDAAPLTLSLPSTRHAPAASPFLLRDDDRGDTRLSGAPDGLRTWNVPALLLRGQGAVTLLIAAGDATHERATGEIAVADDLRFLCELEKLALSRVAGGAVIPVLMRRDGTCVARWQRVETGAVPEYLQRLRSAMPPSLRAAEPEQAPEDLLDGAFDGMLDTISRGALATWAGRGQRDARGGSRRASREWWTALASGSGEIGADDIGLERARVALESWSAPMREASARAFRLCLRLEPPAEDRTAEESASDTPAESDDGEDTWRLEFLLQAMDDPTLLVAAADVWRTRGRVLSAAGRRLEDPQERLLEDLGRAMRLFVPMAEALREAAPTGLALDTGAAHAFLRDAAGALEQAGFGVLVPSWWGAASSRLGLQLRARPALQDSRGSGSGIGVDAVCAYDWRIALGDETLTPAEFRRLARLKQPLLRVRGRWVELRSEDVEAALAAIGAEDDRTLTVGDVLRAGAGVAPSAGLPVVSVVAQGWLNELLANANGDRIRPATAPAAFEGVLRPYQERGLSWLAFLDRLGLGACLADDMGLGKTIQLLALLLAERDGAPRSLRRGSRSSVGPTLLVCPMSVVGNWQHEAARFAPSLRVHVHHGGERLTGGEFARRAARSDVVITTYALAARDRDILAGVKWWRVALDEAQNIKNSATRQAQALRSLTATRRVALTGTPVENRLAELWSILDFLNPGLLGSQRSFRERFATPIERYGDDDRAAALRRITAPFILRRVKTDRSIIEDLPDRIDIKEYCNLTREQASLYQAVVDEMMRKIEQSEGIERRGLVLATMLRLKQVCNHPAHLMADDSSLEGRSGKLERLEEVLEEAVATGERALVFTQFAAWGHRLKSHLQRRLGREIAFLHGGTSRKDRDGMVARFQSGGGAAVLVLSLKAGGTGLNLTAANHVVHFDRWWNPAVEEQASDRAFRIGQTRNVQVRKFICAGTLEERIDEMIDRKKALAQRIVGAGEAWLTELSTEELKRVVALSADAVAEQG
jgi:non-specific serine/threonine protein kinase